MVYRRALPAATFARTCSPCSRKREGVDPRDPTRLTLTPKCEPVGLIEFHRSGTAELSRGETVMWFGAGIVGVIVWIAIGFGRRVEGRKGERDD